MMEDLDFDDREEDAPGADNIEGLYNIRDDMDAAKCTEMEANVRPVKMMLLKVSGQCVLFDEDLPWYVLFDEDLPWYECSLPCPSCTRSRCQSTT